MVLTFGANDIRELPGGADDFRADYEDLVQTYVDLPCHPVVILGLTIPRYDEPYYNERILGDVRDTVLAVAEKYGLPVIDFYSAFLGHGNEYYSDQIHPDNSGYGILADLVYDRLCELEGLSR